MSNWTQPICEADWIEQNIKLEEGHVMIRQPFLLAKERRVETCAWCGKPTVVGIYTRVDPSTVPYPQYEEDDESFDPARVEP